MFSSDKHDRKTPPRQASRTSGSAPSLIGSDVRLTGDIISPGEVQFDGTIEGDIRCGALIIGDQAVVTGSIVSDTVLINGAVMGSIRARSVRMNQSAKMVGDIWHEDLVIESGAYVEGRCMHVDDPLEEKSRKPETSPATAGATAKPATTSPALAAPKPNGASASDIGKESRPAAATGLRPTSTARP